MKLHSLFISLVVILFISCNADEKGSTKIFAIDGQTEDGFESGDYCAEVTYYNPRTGTTNEYTLKVEVDDNEVQKIYFNNGGWLDDTHITPQELDDDGECTLTSDKGIEYSIKIIDRKYKTYSSVELEDPEPPMTFADCARLLIMTYEEKEYYKKTFDGDDSEEYNEAKCELELEPEVLEE